MNQSNLSNWLKVIIIGMGLCGALIYIFVLPVLGKELALSYPEFSYCYLPWLIFLWITAIPCYLVLLFSWKIASEIGADNSFSYENANSLKKICHFTLADVAFFFLGNVVFLFLNMNHPGILLLSLLVDFIGIAIAVAAAALSHLVYNAAQINEENALTI